MNVFVARQPIFDRESGLFGYELLYRTNAEENWAAGADVRTMSSDVIIHAVLNLGLDRITGGSRAFINFTSDMLVTDLYELLDPEQVVVKLLENVACDDYTVRACKRLSDAGYTLALDDFSDPSAVEPLLGVADIVKLDLLKHSPEELSRLVQALQGYDVQLMAKRVETVDAYELAKSLGFEYFQGYHFARPEILSNRDIPTEGMSIIKVLNLLRDPSTTDEQLAAAFVTSPALSFQLLRIVSSSSRPGPQIASLLHAIKLLGKDKLHRWLSLLFGSSLVSRNDVDPRRAVTAIARARMCEHIGNASGRTQDAGAMFLVGLFSALDSLLDVPLADILSRIDLAGDIKAALLDHRGPFANPLELVRKCELGIWEEVPLLAEASGVNAGEVAEFYIQALTWSRDRMQEEYDVDVGASLPARWEEGRELLETGMCGNSMMGAELAVLPRAAILSSTMTESQRLTATGAEPVWLHVCDALIGGIAHALSNRIATLSAMAELSSLDPQENTTPMLRQETGRLETLVQHLRLLSGGRDMAAEALQMPGLVSEAAALHVYHRELREVEITVESDPAVLPVSAQRARTLQAVLLMLTASSSAAREIKSAGAKLRVRCEGEGSTVVVRVHAGEGLSATDLPPLNEEYLAGATALVSAAGGQMVVPRSAAQGVLVEMRLPSLLEVRARERGSQL